jgi:hypothetical protein
MSENVTVSISHKLGKEEALRRIRTGLARAREKGAGLMQFSDETWTGDKVAFGVSVLGQSASGSIDVHEGHVVIDVRLPWLLAKMADKAKALIEKQGQVLLEHKK